MKILIRRAYEGERSLTVLPWHRAHMSPIELRGSDKAALLEQLLAVLVAIEAREAAPAPPAL